MDFEQDIENCLAVLKQGGTILYPTDTVWGIGCDATNAEAVEKIYSIKKRPGQKSMIVLAAGEQDILKYTAAADLSLFDYLQENSRPTTVIYEGAIGLADNLLAEDGSIGIRICGDEFCKHLIRRFRKPIVSTSANISGEPAPARFAEIKDEIKDAVDYVVRHRQNDNTPAKPSSIIRWHNGEIEIIRP